jgi:quinoprotein dehydrogenase-associated probable ABC transporter substrate-binding protein
VTSARRHSNIAGGIAAGTLVTMLSWLQPAAAQAPPPDEKSDPVLRVCADPSGLPQSNDRGEGYENQIAQALAKDLGKKVEYTFFPQRMGFVRNTLRARDEATLKFKCDLIIGVPAGYDLTATTRPYMRSTFALVFTEKHPEFKSFKVPEDLLALPPEKLQKLRIGIFGRSPAADWLLANNLIERAEMYAPQSGDPKETANTIVARDLGTGKIDLAVVWGPIAGQLTRDHASWTSVAFEPNNKFKFDYEMAMGLRQGEKEWKDALDQWIGSHHEQINQILIGYQIPLLELTAPEPGT